MRVLKSLLLLISLFSICHVQAQDSTTVIDTTFDLNSIATTDRDTTFVFHANKPTGIVQWKVRTVPDSTLQHLRNDEAFWYANANFKKKTEEANNTSHHSFLENLFQQRWFYNLLWIVIIGSCVAVMILFLLKSNITFFRKSPGVIASSKQAAISEDIFSIPYDEALKKAIVEKDFRLAIRLHFLQVLMLLAQKNLIQYKEDITNSDYLQQLYQTTYYAPFKMLTRHFEYSWYGHFDVAPHLYERIAAEFNAFKSSMDI